MPHPGDRARRQTERALLLLRPLLAEQGLTLGLAATGSERALPAGPREAALASDLLPARRLEFLAGRRAARRALAAAGLPTGEILSEGRRPVPPGGSVVTITHAGGVAVALAASAAHHRAVGCDLELRGLPSAGAHLVLTAAERRWVFRAARPAGRAYRLLVFFSAKEAAFKAFSALLPAGTAPTTLLGIAARPLPDGFRAWPRDRPDGHLDVAVRRAGPGVFSWTSVQVD